MSSGVLTGQLCEVWGNFVPQRSPQWKGIFGKFSRLFLFGLACTVQYLPWNGTVSSSEYKLRELYVQVVVGTCTYLRERRRSLLVTHHKEQPDEKKNSERES